jgi:hypothetical protein
MESGLPFQARGNGDRIPLYPLLHECEGEKATNGPKEMVVAARTHATRVRSQKIVDH